MKSKEIRKNNTVVNGVEPPLEAINDILRSASRILVASHVDPDGDALGTQLAFAAYLESIGKRAFLVRENNLPAKYQFLKGINEIPKVDSYMAGSAEFDAAVVLECPNLERIGRASHLLHDDIRIINIDHHQDNDGFGEVSWINVGASSVGEMIAEFFERVNFKPDADIAEQLYTAILTDTGRFRFRSTSPRTMQIAGELIEAGADPQKICDFVYYNMEPSTMTLIGKVLNTIEFHHDGRICLLTLTREMLHQAEAEDSESDGLVDYTLFNSGVIAGALFKEIDGKATKVSLRSKDGINVAEIAARFGGGGHFNASGCTMEMAIATARDEMIKILSKAIDEQKR